jgi:hypothetical protein
VQERWWNWAMSRPDGVDVISDIDGTWCAYAQPDDVWFLAGTFGGPAVRSCTVPAGRPLVFPLVNRLCDETMCKGFLELASGSASVDGVALKPEALTGPVTVTGVADNAVTGDDQPERFIACGLWAYVPPLAPGTHRITFSGQAQDFTTSAQYLLTVAA